MALLISVAPAGEGWAVSSEALDSDLTFDRGARAEAAARALADEYADAGRHAEVRIFLRDGALAGRFMHPARDGAAALRLAPGCVPGVRAGPKRGSPTAQ